MRSLLLLSVILLSACQFTGVSAEEKLRDAVVGINDEVRWNRMDLAVQRVTPEYRSEFTATHYDWHRALEIADSEIVHVQIGEERESAASIVTVRWYRHSTMILEETTLRQTWKKVVGGYVLTGERIVEGEEALLEIPEAFLEEADSEEDEGHQDGEDASDADDDASDEAVTDTLGDSDDAVALTRRSSEAL